MSLKKVWCLFLILSIAKVCQGQLMCYVCDDCAKVTAETPQFECNEEFFNNGGTTDSSVQTTTTIGPAKTTEENVSTTRTTTTTEETTTDKATETTTDMVNESTMETTNETSTIEVVTETTVATNTTAQPQPPTPPTVGPPMTTTALPTPPNIGSISSIDDVEKLNNKTEAHKEQVNKDEVDELDEVYDFDMEKITTKAYKPSAEFRVRQLRSVSDFTYHCFKINATNVNGTMVINRGCSRVQTMESVCGQWENQHPNEKINKCYPCTRSKCNGSSALSVSITALFMALIAVFMHMK